MNSKKALNAYIEIDNNLTGADFEKKWFESVIMVLNRIQSGSFYNQVETHVKLIEICDGLQWIQENLNEKLNSQHRTLLKQIYSLSIQIINGAIATNNMTYLSIVTASLKTVLEPYCKTHA
jgi:hypothetical protein